MWSAIGILAGALLGMFFYLGNKIDDRIDSLSARMDARFDSLTVRIDALIDRHIH